MKIEKRHIIAGAIGLFTVSGAVLYWQYTKLMDYKIKVKRVFVNKASLTNLDFDLTLDFTNNSNLKFSINSQSYSAYLNGTFIGKAVNFNPTAIKPGPGNMISVKVTLNPSTAFQAFKTNVIDMITHPEKVKVKVVMDMNASIFGITKQLPYTYEATLKEMTAPKPKETV